MKVKILEGRPGSPDGVTVVKYKKGDVVDMPAHLANVFVGEKWAEPFVDAPVAQAAPAPAAKMVVAAPENKADTGPADGKKADASEDDPTRAMRSGRRA